MRLIRCWILAVALALAGPMQAASALEGYPDNWCRSSMFGGPYTREPGLYLGRVIGNGRAHLLSDTDGCPLNSMSCRKDVFINDAFVSPATFVAVLPSMLSGFTCVLDAGDLGSNTGWLPKARVQMLPVDRNPPLTAWTGVWRSLGDNMIVLTVGRDGRLSVDGEAYWPSRDIPPSHSGGLSGAALPDGNRVTFEHDDDRPSCIVKLELLSPDLLAANDNGRCGGYNVSFGGVYKHAHSSERARFFRNWSS